MHGHLNVKKKKGYCATSCFRFFVYNCIHKSPPMEPVLSLDYSSPYRHTLFLFISFDLKQQHTPVSQMVLSLCVKRVKFIMHFLFATTHASYPAIISFPDLSTPRILGSSIVMFHVFNHVLLYLCLTWFPETILAV